MNLILITGLKKTLITVFRFFVLCRYFVLCLTLCSLSLSFILCCYPFLMPSGGGIFNLAGNSVTFNSRPSWASKLFVYLSGCTLLAYRGGGEIAVKVLILGRKSKTVFFIADSLQGKIKSLVYLSGKQKLFKKNVSMDTPHRSIK